MPSIDALARTSESQRPKRRKTIPPPSKRPGLRVRVPETIGPALGFSAHPVEEPRSRASSAPGEKARLAIAGRRGRFAFGSECATMDALMTNPLGYRDGRGAAVRPVWRLEGRRPAHGFVLRAWLPGPAVHATRPRAIGDRV